MKRIHKSYYLPDCIYLDCVYSNCVGLNYVGLNYVGSNRIDGRKAAMCSFTSSVREFSL